MSEGHAEPSQDEDESYKESNPDTNPEDQDYAKEELRKAKEFEADTQLSESSHMDFDADTQETPASPVFQIFRRTLDIKIIFNQIQSISS